MRIWYKSDIPLLFLQFVLPLPWPRGVTLAPRYWQPGAGGREEQKNSLGLSWLHEKLKGIYFLVGSQAENTI